jgi:RNA polymerase sigma-54 factor
MIPSHAVHLQHLRTLKMTPQLRQAIGILQFNNRQLAAFLAIQATSNPYLKLVTVGDPPPSPTGAGGDTGGDRRNQLRDAPRGPASQSSAASDWRETEDRVASPADGLYAHVRRQIDLSIRDPRQKAIACFLTEALEPSGWLGRPLDKIAREAGCSVEEAECVLGILQGFEPTGLFARSLAECLGLQAAEAQILTDPMALVLDNLELAGRGEIDRLARLGKTTPEAIMAQLKAIRRLNPKPGAAFDGAPMAIVPPDLVAREVDGNWQVELNRSSLPAITIEKDIRPDAPELPHGVDKALLLSEAQWLEKAVARRNVTTLTIAAEIVRRQTGFLSSGPAHLVPMSLADVASAAGVHESTVSRVTAGLMMATPRGTLPMRDFFSVGLPNKQGEDSVSASAVRDEIRRMISREDVDHPVSDAALADHFKSRGVAIARRTVAKYRDMLQIPGSAARKRRARLAKSRGAG